MSDFSDKTDTELNRICAVEVMGWRKGVHTTKEPSYRTGKMEIIKLEWYALPGGGRRHARSWSPTTNGVDRDEVTDEIERRGWEWYLHGGSDNAGFSIEDEYGTCLADVDDAHKGRAVVLAAIAAVRST